MSSAKDNNILEKTSFLYGNNSQFIEDLYSDYSNNPNGIPSEIAQTTIFRVSQKPNNIVGA